MVTKISLKVFPKVNIIMVVFGETPDANIFVNTGKFYFKCVLLLLEYNFIIIYEIF